ncbi:MAG: hypothetical protein JWO88_2989 [Frankiales bacterium]|nr:hypothetical protein [Frankiales bacterium]
MNAPLDDELRSLLHARADVLSPAPDPLAGIERRANRMRRNRVAASVAGTALAVAAIAVAVPSLVPGRHGAASQLGGSTPTPSAVASPSTARTYGPNELDPAHPWDYRGDQAALANGNLDTLRRDWDATHPGAVLSPLFGQVDAASKQPEIVFVSHSPTEDRWGMSTTSESGTKFLVDKPFPADSSVLMAALSGDAVPRLVVVAGPATGDMSYAVDGVSWHTVVGSVQGVAFVPLQGDTSRDAVRVLDGNGDMDHPVFEGPAPDAFHSSGPMQTFKPVNYIQWQTRGTVDPSVERQAVSAFGQAIGDPTAVGGHHVLFGGKDKAGRIFVFMQAWATGQDAHTFGFVSDGKGGGEPFYGPVTAQDPPLLAYLMSAAPGQSTDTLLLLPRPGAGPFSYASSATAPYRTVGNARSDLQNTALIDRDPKATSDRVQVLAGDGMQILYDGLVQPLLCGASGCG